MATVSGKDFFGGQPGKVIVPAAPSPETQQTPGGGGGFFSSIGPTIGKNVLDEVKGGARQIGSAFKSAAHMGDPFHAGLRIAGGAASVVNAPFNGLIKSVVDATSNAVSDIPVVQDFSNTKQGKAISEIHKKAADVIAKHPQAAQDISDLVNVFSMVAGAEGLRSAVPEMKGVIPDTVEGVTRSAATTQKVLEGWQSKNILTRNALTDTEAVGKILQGKPGDVEAGLKTLREIPTEGVKTYKDLSNVLDQRAKNLTSKVDEVLGADKQSRPLKNLSSEENVGGQKVKFNYVEQALKDLRELYKTTTSPKDAARIDQLLKKGGSKGFTAKEINDIAREYGTEFGKKAFNAKTGDALTSVNAQSYENVRTGVKEAARNVMPDAGSKAIDKEITDTLNTKRLVDQMNTKVNALQQRVQQRTLVEKVARKLGGALDLVTMGGPKAFVAKLFFPSNVGLKTLNAIDLEEMLTRNLKIIQKASTVSDDELVNILTKQAKEMEGL